MRAHFRWSISKYCLALSVAVFALSAPAQSQTLPVIGDPAPSAIVTIHVGDGTITGEGTRTVPHRLARDCAFRKMARPLTAGFGFSR